jgi:hypothetical protein
MSFGLSGMGGELPAMRLGKQEERFTHLNHQAGQIQADTFTQQLREGIIQINIFANRDQHRDVVEGKIAQATLAARDGVTQPIIEKDATQQIFDKVACPLCENRSLMSCNGGFKEEKHHRCVRK